MNNLMLMVLSLSLAGSIIIALLFLCKPLYKERLSKKWQYYIWLIVIVRLLVPISFEVNFVGSLFNEIGQANVFSFLGNEQGNAVIGGDGAVIIGSGNEAHATNPDLQNLLPPMPETQTPVPHSQSDILSVLISHIWLIWIVVAAILFIRKITIYQSFAGYIKAGRVPLENMADLERFGKLVEQANIKRMVGIYTNNLVSSPLLIGFFKPYIVLPTTDISEADFKHTIMHELTHYKRGDMFYKWLVQFTMCLHWFNPLVYLMGREINNACEFSCDEAVIKDLNNDGIKEYGNTLLNALGFGGEYKNSLSSVTLSENKKILEERLDMIKNFKKKPWFTTLCAALLAVILVAGAGVIGVYGLTSPQADQENQANQANQTDEPQANARTIDGWLDRQLAGFYTFAENEIVRSYIFTESEVEASGNHSDRREWADEWIASRYQWKEDWIADRHEWAAELRDLYDRELLTIIRDENGDIISLFPNDNAITATAPFSAGSILPHLPNENRQILLTSIQGMENRDDVFEFSYDPQTNVIWISNTGEREDVPPNHVNVRCADTGEIFHIQILETIDGVPQLAFFVEIADDGRPFLVSIDNTTRPNIIADGNITIGLQHP